jgi:hypothetical protein
MTIHSIRLNKLLLLAFPATFMVLQFLLKLDYKFFFLSAHDPSYGYLFNGLNLTQCNMELGLSAHPGTPLTCLAALNIFLINLFSGRPQIPDSVLMNPEYYLNMISYEIILFNTIALIFLGFRTYNRLKDLPLSLALQLTPFMTLQGFCFDSIVMLEPLITCIEILILTILSGFTFGQGKSITGRNLIFIAIFMALGIALKIVCLPLMFLPFFAIEGLRNRAVYCLTILFSFIILLIPIYKVFPSFLTWIKALFMHSGNYGSGKADIIDFTLFVRHIGSILTANYLYTACFVLIIGTMFASRILRLKSRIDPKKRMILQGLSLVFLVNGLMVAKHFSGHYLIISYNLVAFGFLLLLHIYSDLGVFGKAFQVVPFRSALVLLAGILLVMSLVLRIHFSKAFVNPRLKALEFVEKTAKRTPRIIVLENPGPFIETALFHGFAYSGGMRPVYAGILKKNYPGSFFYNKAQDIFHDWTNELNLIDLLSRNSKTYLYYSSKNDTLPPNLVARLNDLIHRDCILDVKPVYNNPERGEYIYVIDANKRELAGKITKHEIAGCNFEKLTSGRDRYVSSDSTYKFTRADLQSSEAAFSGGFSLRLNPENPFGSGIKLIAQNGYYKVSVMRHCDDDNGLIVAADETGTELYKANSLADSEDHGWDSLNLTIDIPEKIIGKEISIYLWYPGKGTCFFDDLNITYFEINQN